MRHFSVSRQPRLVIEDAAAATIVNTAVAHGPAVVVTGGNSIRSKKEWNQISNLLDDAEVGWIDFSVSGEPSPSTVDGMRDRVTDELPGASVVVGIGGGSVIDTAKALAALLEMEGSVVSYLEGVGDRTPTGATLPLIAVPTTAGTGSEATKNAVLSRVGAGGFKKSLRHDSFIPAVAIIDATLYRGAPDTVTRASGLDAITQLIEAYVSTNSNTIVDALIERGLQLAGRSLPILLAGDDTLEARRDMGLAAYLSGVALASAGLGAVHGIASPAGAARPIPHGVVCGLLVAEAAELSVARGGGVAKYAAAGRIIGGLAPDVSDEEAAGLLVTKLRSWASPLPRMSSYGFTRADLDDVAAASGNKNQPCVFDANDFVAMMERVL